MQTVMSNKAWNKLGKFVLKPDTLRKIRSVNITDETWQRLAAVAEKTGKSRNDFLESLLQSNNPFIKTVKAETANDEVNITQQPDSELCPLMETDKHQTESLKLPEASELLNRLKTKRKKATASLADVEAILEILEE